jgi:tRNA nucleotidyltransferase (CCA-adding enzyme)
MKTQIEEKIVCILKQNNYEVWYVGGAVRDFMLGLEPHDIDIVTNAKPEEILKAFEGKGFTTKLIGDSFPVVAIDGVEVATYRTEISTGPGHKDFEVAYAETLEEDLYRRDFTCGAMAMCPVGGDIIDMFGGVEDTKERIIRFVGDPYETIRQDPVRMLRAFRFAAKLGAEIEKETFEAIKAHRDMIKYVTMERIRLEIMKAMEADKPSIFFTLCQEAGILEYFLPSLASCWKHDHGKFHDEDVFEHCMFAGDAITYPCSLLRLTGFLHDVGKPKAFEIAGDGSFVGHERIGKDLLVKELTRLKFSTDEVLFITGLVKFHMTHFKDFSQKAARRLLARLSDKKVSLQHLLRLKMADRKGSLRKGKSYDVSFLKSIIGTICDVHVEPKTAFSVKDLAITGFDVMEIMQVKPGPIVGHVLKEIFELVLDDPELNEKHILRAIL